MKISKATFYKWYKIYNHKIKNDAFYNFNFLNVTSVIIDYIISCKLSNFNIGIKKIKKNLNTNFKDNKISLKQIGTILDKNKFIFINRKSNNRSNYKINNNIEKFIIDSINNNSILVAKDFVGLVKNKFKIDILLTSIYNIFKKNNYVYKKTTININPHSFDDQEQQLNNVLYYLENNETINVKQNEIKQNEINLVSIDEFSIITNKTSNYGWALKGKECIVKIPFTKPNKRYSLLMATTNKKIIKYILVEGSIKTDNFISFMDELYKINNNFTFLIDNASIHTNKKVKK